MSSTKTDLNPYERLEIPAFGVLISGALLVILALASCIYDLLFCGALQTADVAQTTAATSALGTYYETMAALQTAYWCLAGLLGIAVVAWSGIAHENLERFDPSNRSNPQQVWTGFLIPLYNLWHSKQMMEAILDASQPKRVLGGPPPPKPYLVRGWWTSMLLAGLLTLAGLYKHQPASAGQVKYHLLGMLLAGISTVLLLVLVRRLTRYQAARCGMNVAWLGTVPAPVQPMVLPRGTYSGVPAGEAEYELLVIAGADTGQVFPLRGGQLLIGRREPGTPPVAGALGVQESSVSRVHALIEYNATIAGYTVTHRSSTNLTVLNEIPLTHLPMPLRPGDHLRMGRLELVFRVREGAPSAALARVDQAPIPWAGSGEDIPFEMPSNWSQGAPAEVPTRAFRRPPVLHEVPEPASGDRSIESPADPGLDPGQTGPTESVASLDQDLAETSTLEIDIVSSLAEPNDAATPGGASDASAPDSEAGPSKDASAQPRAAGKVGLFKALPLLELTYQVQTASSMRGQMFLRIDGPHGEQQITLDKTAYTMGGPARSEVLATHLNVGDSDVASDAGYLLWNQATWEFELHTSELATGGLSVKRKSGRGNRTTLVGPGKALALREGDRILAGKSELTLVALG